MASSPTRICKTHSKVKHTRFGLTIFHDLASTEPYSDTGAIFQYTNYVFHSWEHCPAYDDQPFPPPRAELLPHGLPPSMETSPGRFTQQTLNKCCPTCYEGRCRWEISLFLFTNISSRKDLTVAVSSHLMR